MPTSTCGDSPGAGAESERGRPVVESFSGIPGLTELIARYQTILLDAYGVLVNSTGPLPAARAMLDAIANGGRDCFVVTNDASRLPDTAAERFARFDLPISAGQIITSGSLLAAYYAEHGLQGALTMVLGPADSEAYVRAAGGQIASLEADTPCDAVVVCDEAGYPFLETADNVLSALYRQLDRDRPVALILPNPDLIYPKRDGTYGFTSGAISLMLEAGLARRYPGRGLTFTRLGKPHRPIFDRAREWAGTDSLLMVGDQIETDIAGARGAGIDSVLVTTGVSRWDEAEHLDPLARPNYLLTL